MNSVATLMTSHNTEGKGTICQLMKEPLIMWDGGQSLSECKAAEVDHRSANCWYNNPYYNITFGNYCDRSKCTVLFPL
jgi:hypothetical protein